MTSDQAGKNASADNECMNAFKIDTNHVFQKDRNARCAPDTGQWFFHHPEYEAFQGGKGLQLLFVTAEAGGGKSTIARTLVDRVQGSEERPLVAYFFFKDDDDQLRSYEDALSSILYQLFSQERGLIKHAKDVYKRHRHGVRYQTKEMWNILTTIAVEAQRKLVCVLDAVDECAPGGRRQLVSDLADIFKAESQPVSSQLKFVVTSRPYQDQNHPYRDLVASPSLRHLAGENAKVQADIQAVIRFKASQLAGEQELSEATTEMLIDTLSRQNQQTRSFLAVRLAFELLNSDDLMHKRADSHTICTILADIPQSLGDQLDAMLNRSPDKEHARRLLCVILAARKTLKVPEFKVLYAMTRPRNSATSPPQSYEDLEIPADDEEFKQLVRARCGLFVTFVRSSVHLFHQTAREHLMARTVTTSNSQDSPPTTISEPHPVREQELQQPWKGCITKADANLVVLNVCLDLFNFPVPKRWVLDVFDTLNAGNGFHDEIVTFIKDKPLFQYAALNWYEHAALGGAAALTTLCTVRGAAVMDVSQTAFWVWFLALADYMCTSTARPEAIIAGIWEEPYKKYRLKAAYGVVLREACLGRFFGMDGKVRNLLDDSSLPIAEVEPAAEGPVWTASNGYDWIDGYHLAFGEYQYTSSSRAVQCIEHGQVERSRLLSPDVPISTMIWTCISERAPNALKNALATVQDITWLDKVPDHIMYRRTSWNGWSSRTGENLREDRAKGWTDSCPPAFAAIYRAMSGSTSSKPLEVFSVLADWVESSDRKNDYAQKLWEAGGFIEPSFGRRLIILGASIDAQLWSNQRTALQITAALWEHDAVETLIELGADSTVQTPDQSTPLHWFLRGPETTFKDQHSGTYATSKAAISRLPPQEQQRRRKARIASTLKALCRPQSGLSPLEQPDSTGKYPLMLAARNSSTATKALLEGGAKVEQKDHGGRTALMHYFCGKFAGRPPAILTALLKSGADSTATDAFGHTVLQFWVRQLFAMDMSSLYPGFNRFNKTFDILTSTGALANDEVLIKHLKPLEIPLSAAVRLGNTKLCWALLKTGANPDKHGLTKTNRLPENNGSEAGDLSDMVWKPLLIALKHKAYTTAALLLAFGADVTFKIPRRKRTRYNKYTQRKCGLTALHLAVGAVDKWFGTGSLSLNSGWSACAFRAVGDPEYKVKKEHPEMDLAKFQMKHWKNTSRHKDRFRDENSDSEYELPKTATSNDNRGDKLLPYDKLSETMRASMKLDDPLYDVIVDPEQTPTLRQKALVELLLRKSAPVNAQTLESLTPLACVHSFDPLESPGPPIPTVKSSDADLARLLIQYGADPNLASTDGCTPLMRAAKKGDHNIVEVLLSAGANPDAQLKVGPLKERQCSSFIERDRWTYHRCDAPLTALALAAEQGHYDVIELLLKHGADPNLPTEHHAHGRLPSLREKRRRGRGIGEEESSDSDDEPEKWKGYIGVGTALSWARDEVRELLLRNGADPKKEQPLRECDCAVIEKRKERGWNESDDEWPARSEGEGTDAELRRHRKYPYGLENWDGDTDQGE